MTDGGCPRRTGPTHVTLSPSAEPGLSGAEWAQGKIREVSGGLGVPTPDVSPLRLAQHDISGGRGTARLLMGKVIIYP